MGSISFRMSPAPKRSPKITTSGWVSFIISKKSCSDIIAPLFNVWMDCNRYSSNCQALYNTWPDCTVAFRHLDRGSGFWYNGPIRKQDWGGRGGCLLKTTLWTAVVFSQIYRKTHGNPLTFSEIFCRIAPRILVLHIAPNMRTFLRLPKVFTFYSQVYTQPNTLVLISIL